MTTNHAHGLPPAGPVARCRFCGHQNAPTRPGKVPARLIYAPHNQPGGVADHDGAKCFKSRSQIVWPQDVKTLCDEASGNRRQGGGHR